MKLLPRTLLEKQADVYISALELASPGNRHCANCIGALSFAIYEQRLLLVADDGPVRRARQVCESNAARIIGLVMLVASFLPFGVMIGADALQFARWLYQRQPSTVKRHQTAPL